ncbi:TonB-dependent siderophore receptor [Achromobacter pestifer]|uniref:Ferrichrome outer membrane transporter/phage receptor n=1 Tax=Achromobacter pestifer TaxID=1353889 RepID=A0A6S6YPX2_9BURK|nr:TonB-dependent siderophore receptor [Achromobacter pestifer]CAB3635500.1 Ferrichrome outer membrane transporter/phage receptor [Achromobacter pestifer]
MPLPTLNLRYTPLAFSLLLATLSTAALPAHAQQQTDAAIQYDIPAGPLALALNRYAQQAGVAISVDANRIQGLTTPGLQGRYRLDEGFRMLLAGSGYAATRSAGGYVLVPAPQPGTTTLPAVRVSGQGFAGALEPTSGLLASTSTSATKTDTPLREIPQSVSVVTREQIDEQKPRSVTEALRYTPGAFTGLVGAADRYDYVALRGFIENSTDNTIYDGLKLLSDSGTFSSIQIDPYFVERIDVFRGPSSVLFGRSAPGGLVQLTSKRPLFDPYRSVEVSYGTQGQKSAGFDFAGPVDDNGKVAYRLTGLGRSTDTQFNNTREERYAIAPQVMFNVTPDTSLLLQAYLQRDPSGGFHSGVPADASITDDHAGQRISRHFVDSDPDNNEFKRNERIFSYQLDHRFNDRWTFRQNARYVSSDVRLKQAYGYGWANDTELTRYYSGADESLNAFAIDNQIQGKFETGAVKHTVLLGLDYQNRHADGRWDSGTASNLDAFHPNYADGNVQITSRTFFDRRLEQTGFYLQDQLAYDRWRFTVSGRQDEVRIKESNRTGDYSTKQDWRGSKFTKRAGLVYLFDNGVSPYLSYSESFNPNAYTDQQGNLLPPTQSKQYEAGVKFQQPGTENMVSMAAFDLTQDNVANRVLAQTYYAPAGKVRSRGIELEGKARLTDNLTLLAAYTFTAMTYRESTEGLTGNTPYQAPRHMASLWGDYQFDSGLGVGAGVRYVGTSWADSANTLKVPAYTLVDLSVRYDLGRLSSSLKGMSVRVAANNLLDKTYVASCASLNYCYYGEERNVVATLKYEF